MLGDKYRHAQESCNMSTIVFRQEQLIPILSLAIISCCVSSAIAADLDKYQASAILHTWIYAAEGIANRCTRAHPELSKQIQSDIATWQRNDKIAINQAEKLWRQMQAISPRAADEEREDAIQLERLWIGLSSQHPGDPPNAGKSRCSTYFADRSKGMLRSRRSDVFSALEGQ